MLRGVNLSFLQGRNRRPRFVGAIANTGGTTMYINLPAGTQVGDIAIVIGSGNNPTGFAQSTGWSTTHLGDIDPGNGAWAAVRRIVANDISDPTRMYVVGSTITTYSAIVYRGASSVSIRTNNLSTGTTFTHTGFTKAGNACLVVAGLIDRDPSAGVPAINQNFAIISDLSTTYHEYAFAEKVASQYVNGDTPQWSGLAASFGQGGIMVELRN